MRNALKMQLYAKVPSLQDCESFCAARASVPCGWVDVGEQSEHSPIRGCGCRFGDLRTIVYHLRASLPPSPDSSRTRASNTGRSAQ